MIFLKIPVYLGCFESILNYGDKLPTWFGHDGLGDLEDYGIVPDLTLLESDHAVTKMHELITLNPNKITIISLGPLTNLALCLKQFKNVRNEIQEIFIMGGNHPDVGNKPNNSEFNFAKDPDAAYIVLHTAKCPITILPWETCIKENFYFPIVSQYS